MTANKKIIKKSAGKNKEQGQIITIQHIADVNRVAERLTKTLNHPDVSDEIKDVLTGIVFEAGNESGLILGAQEDPGAALPGIIRELSIDEGRGFLTCIKSVLSYNVPPHVLVEASPCENSALHGASVAAAEHISAIIDNPNTPRELSSRLVHFLNDLLINSPAQERVTDADNLSREYIAQIFESWFPKTELKAVA